MVMGACEGRCTERENNDRKICKKRDDRTLADAHRSYDIYIHLGVLAVRIDNETGEIIETEANETTSVKYQLALSEFNRLPVVDTWLQKKEDLEMAKEQFEMIDKPFRKAIKDLFERFSIHRLSPDYIDIIEKNGYTKKTWDGEKLVAFIKEHGGNPSDFYEEKWVNGTIQIKEKR